MRWVPVLFVLLSVEPASSALIDRWVASDLQGFDNGDGVGSWASRSNRLALSSVTEEPVFLKDATPSGRASVQFAQSRMTVASSPVAGLTQFSVALVFRVDAAGVDEGAGWSTKSGIVDANLTGITNDWGIAVRETGFVCFGTGHPGAADSTVYLDNQPTYPSVADGKYHVLVATWGGGAQTLYLDKLPAKTQSGVSTMARTDAGLSFGGIHTGEPSRRFSGEIAEVQFHNTALTSAEVGALISDLSSAYLTNRGPGILSFTSSADTLLVGASATLSWAVTNADQVWIDNGIGIVPSVGSAEVFPASTTSYTLTASNNFGIRNSQLTVVVDPGLPRADSANVSVARDTPRNISLTGSDPQGATLTFHIVQHPSHGSLSGAPPGVIYTPNPGYTGEDAFTFKVNDGQYDSAPAVVQIYVDDQAKAPHGIFFSTSQINAKSSPGTFLGSFRAADTNRFDSHSFTLVSGPGATHNSFFSISGQRLFASSGFPFASSTNLSIRVRATDPLGLWAEKIFSLDARTMAVPVVINEIHYNPSENVIREEFIELHNPGSSSFDISGWRIRGGVDYIFPPNTVIPARGFVVTASHPPTILSRYGVSALGPWSGNLSSDGERITLRDTSDAVVDEVDYASEFPWPIAANGNGSSMELANPYLDNDLGSSWRASLSAGAPSPGSQNWSFSTNAAPNIRQVQHSPRTPASSATVRITAKVTDVDGVASVLLQYQVVSPGKFIPSYIPLSVQELNANPSAIPARNPAFEASSNWVTVPMRDDGMDGDVTAGDDIYTVNIPMQPNRSLVRYRITCTDTWAISRRAPFEDDPSLNFAYFVYNGIPDYAGVNSTNLQQVPVYFLVTRNEDFDVCTAYNGAYQLPQFSGSVANEARFVFNWPGAFVFNGEVYDHVRYRLRGANGRYQPGKRNFRIRFNDGRFLAATDEFGKPYPRKWATLNTAKGQSNRQNLTFSLNESLNFYLLDKVGVPSPRSHYFHWRVVRNALEAPDNFSGDFYGLSWALEDYDADFLEVRNLPKGNLYKLINAQRATDPYQDMVMQRRYQAPFAVTNGSDAVRIQNFLLNPTTSQTDAWLLENVNYTNWYAYHTILEAVRNYDTWPSANKNAAWFFDTNYTAGNSYNGRFWTLPWDWTDTWGPTWNAGQDLAWNGIFGPTSSMHPDMQRDYRNTAREIRDLLFQRDQIEPLIDAMAARIAAIGPADLRRWSNCPPAGAPYVALAIPGPGLSQGVPGYAQDLKNFMFVGGNYGWWLDRQAIGAGGWVTRLDTLASDSNIPVQPKISYVGQPGYPMNSLTFECLPFADPQGAFTFAAMEWRLAEVLDTNRPPADPRIIPPMEWDTIWHSGQITIWSNRITVPGTYTQTNKLYRVRVRHKDTTGRWSKWSAPVQFSVTSADTTSVLRQGLRISEIMYNPPAWSIYSSDDLEFLELWNRGPEVLDLSGLFFQGITFVFPSGSSLSPGQRIILGRNASALAAKYPGISLFGVYSGRLDNAGETLLLKTPSGQTVLELTYSDDSPWPLTADGLGWSLILADADSLSYLASNEQGGSPGLQDAPSSIPRVLISEVLTHTDPPQVDSVELFNSTSNNVSIGGWFLTDDPTTPNKYRIPNGTIVSSGGFIVLAEAQFNSGPNAFAFSSLGDDVYLFSGSASATNLTGYTHGAKLGASANGVSFGRYVNSLGSEDFVAMSQLTLGTNNSRPIVGPVVFSELMPAPRITGLLEDPSLEFIELRNVTVSNVPLFSVNFPTNTWQLRAGVDFTFPPGTVLGRGSSLLLVGFDPSTNAALLAEFKEAYAVPAHVSILGPWSGRLDNAGESVELYRPDNPQPDGFVPYILAEKVKYSLSAPWPVDTIGTGRSLQRAVLLHYGNDPFNWFSAMHTAGTLGAGTSADADADGLPDTWEMDYDLDPFVHDSATDSDGDTFSNLQEFIAGSNPKSNGSYLRIDTAISSTGSVTASFQAFAGRTYTVLTAPDLNGAAWLTVTNIPAASSDRIIEIDLGGKQTSFFRLQAKLAD